MRVLVACEFSGVVRQAFRNKGHYAWSCDLLKSDDDSKYHIQGDVLDVIKSQKWDLMIAHPPCTHLACSGAKHFKQKQESGVQQKAIEFFLVLANADIPKIAIENPIGIMSSLYGKPDQIIHPYQFGHSVRKATCLWLKGLPLLVPTKEVEVEKQVVLSSGKKMGEWYYETSCLPHKDRAHVRSITFKGIAEAMANQWG